MVYTYAAFWNGNEVTLDAESTFDAQTKAIPMLQRFAGRKTIKGYQVYVALLAKDGVPYVHDGASL